MCVVSSEPHCSATALKLKIFEGLGFLVLGLVVVVVVVVDIYVGIFNIKL